MLRRQQWEFIVGEQTGSGVVLVGKGDLGGWDKVRGRTLESRSRGVRVEDMEVVVAE